MVLMESLDATKLRPEQRHRADMSAALSRHDCFRVASLRHGLSDRSILFGRAAQLQLGNDVFERPPHALRRRRIDRAGIDEEVEAGIMLADDRRSFARLVGAAFHRVGPDRVSDALQRDRLERTRAHHVAHEHEGLVAQHDPARLRNRL